jgi:hypothetical protein
VPAIYGAAPKSHGLAVPPGTWDSEASREELLSRATQLEVAREGFEPRAWVSTLNHINSAEQSCAQIKVC